MSNFSRRIPAWLLLLGLPLSWLPASSADEPDGTTTSGLFEHRNSSKAELVRKHGGSVASEKAVADALRWLAAET